MWKRISGRLQHHLLWLVVTLTSSTAWADLPKPPDSDMASGNSDWIDVGGNLAYKSLRYCCIILGAMVLAGAAYGIAKAYHAAQDKQDLGHFFKHGAVAAVAAAIGLGLLYAGYIIIPPA